MPLYIFFLDSDFRFQELKENDIKNLTGKEFLEKFAPKSKFLYIKTKTRIERVKSGRNIGELIEELRCPEQFKPPPSFLFSCQDLLYFVSFEVYDKHKKLLTNSFIALTKDQLSTLTIKDFEGCLSEKLGFENKPVSLLIDNAAVDYEMKLSELKNPIQNSFVTLVTKITSEGKKLIIKRENVIKEVISSEASYINDLELLESFWQNNLKKMKVFSQKQIDLMFKDIPTILDTHKLFMKKFMIASKNAYFSLIAPTFMEFAEAFKCSLNLITHFPLINEFITEIAKNKQNNTKLKQLAEEAKARDFLSYMVTPVQRIPRYQLFLRELLKCTPKTHNDYIFLPAAQALIEETAKTIDQQSQIIVSQVRVDSIAKDLQNNFQLKKPGRKVIKIFDVLIKGHKENPGIFIVFSDIVCLIKNLQKGHSVLYDSPISAFHFTIGDNDRTIIVTSLCKQYNSSLLNQRKIYGICFKTNQDKEAVMKLIENETRSFVSNLQHNNVLEWKVVSSNIFPYHCSSSGLYLFDKFFIFGGQTTQQRLPSAKLFIIGKDMTIDESTALVAPRYGQTMSFFQGKLYIIGGKTKNKAFKKCLCYNINDKSWSQPLPSGNIDFTARSKHTTVTYNSKFYVFGGKTQNKELLNDVTVFDPQHTTFCVYNNLNNRPSPRSRHASCAIGNKMYMFGGKNGKEILNDFWELDLDKLEWQQIKLSGSFITKRKGHGMLPIGNTLIIYGGTNENDQDVLSFAINVDTKTAYPITDVGNFPTNLKNFTAMTDGRGTFYATGGIEKKSKEPIQAFFKISMNQDWLSTFDLKETYGAYTREQYRTPHTENMREKHKTRFIKRPPQYEMSSMKRSTSAVSLYEMIDAEELEQAKPQYSPLSTAFKRTSETPRKGFKFHIEMDDEAKEDEIKDDNKSEKSNKSKPSYRKSVDLKRSPRTTIKVSVSYIENNKSNKKVKKNDSDSEEEKKPKKAEANHEEEEEEEEEDREEEEEGSENYIQPTTLEEKEQLKRIIKQAIELDKAKRKEEYIKKKEKEERIRQESKKREEYIKKHFNAGQFDTPILTSRRNHKINGKKKRLTKRPTYQHIPRPFVV